MNRVHVVNLPLPTKRFDWPLSRGRALNGFSERRYAKSAYFSHDYSGNYRVYDVSLVECPRRSVRTLTIVRNCVISLVNAMLTLS